MIKRICTILALVLLTSGTQLATAQAPTAAETLALTWAPCPGEAQPGAECTTLTVPLSSDGGAITLALARLPARDPANRIGSLLLNPGGPGGSGVGAVAYDPSLSSAPELAPVRDRFDIIGFDPRGVGASTQITCPDPLHDPAVSPFPRTPADYTALVQLNGKAGRSCREATGPLIDHVDTLSVVDDVEQIRLALGEDRISWLGLSYGTEIGELYAERYPNRVRAMVLDGVVDHSLPAFRAALDEARATEVALRRFADWCASSTECVLRGQDAVAVYDNLLAAAARGEVSAASLGRAVTAEEVAQGAYGYLQLRATWPLLANALAAPDASMLMAAATFTSDTYPAYRTVGCHDFAPRTSGWGELLGQAAALRAVAPHTWRHTEFWEWISGCAGWPVRQANPPRPLSVRGAPPILLVNTIYDPATPYPWAVRVQRAIEGSRLITVDSDGHTGILHSPCARTHMATYLVDGVLPPPGTRC